MGVVVDTGVFILWERRGRSVESRLSEIDRPGFISVATTSTSIDASELRSRRMATFPKTACRSIVGLSQSTFPFT
jgi:hypothetical protein